MTPKEPQDDRQQPNEEQIIQTEQETHQPQPQQNKQGQPLSDSDEGGNQASENGSAPSEPKPTEEESEGSNPVTFGQAAVNMPSSQGESEASDSAESQPVESPAEGGSGTPPYDDDKPKLPDKFEPDELGSEPFWFIPPEPSRFAPPPFVRAVNFNKVQAEIETLCAYLQAAGYEIECHELRTRFYGKVYQSMYEYELLSHKHQAECQELEQAIQNKEKEICSVEQEFAQKFAEARLPVPQTEPAQKKRKSTDQPSPPPEITPAYVELALQEENVGIEVIAGEHGIAPPRERGGFLASLDPAGKWLLELFAPLFAGLILGVNIGIITGFITLESANSLTTTFVLLTLVATFAGMFIEKLVGNGFYHVFSTIAQASEQRGDVQNADKKFPQLRVPPVLIPLILCLLIATGAIVVVDGTGLWIFHNAKYTEQLEKKRNAEQNQRQQQQQQRQQRQQRGQKQSSEIPPPLPFPMYLLAGAVISLPYLTYKAVMGWRSAEIRQRESRLEYLRGKHLEERAKEPAVQEALCLAGRLVSLRNEHAQLSQNLQQIKARIDSARTAAIGAHEEFLEYWQNLLDFLKAERDGHLNGTMRNGKARHHHKDQPKPTLLKRLTDLFRRG